MAEEKPKRKTHTSSAVTNRYKKKTYDRLVLEVKKDIATQYKNKCKEKGIPYSKPLHEAIEEFLKTDS